MTPPTTITQDEYDALKITLAARDARIAQLEEALKICNELLSKAWAENTHFSEKLISLSQLIIQPKESLKARVKKVEAIRDGLIMETWLKGIDAALQHKEDNQ